MLIEFRKTKKGKDILFCRRADGSTTWSELVEGSAHPFVVVPHDLVHFVVETELRLERAFFGFVASGLDLHVSLDASRKLAMRLEVEVLRAEAAAAALFADLVHGPFDQATRIEKLEDACAGWRVLPFEITDAAWEAMRARLETLAAAWRELPRGESLVLSFDIANRDDAVTTASDANGRRALRARAANLHSTRPDRRA